MSFINLHNTSSGCHTNTHTCIYLEVLHLSTYKHIQQQLVSCRILLPHCGHYGHVLLRLLEENSLKRQQRWAGKIFLALYMWRTSTYRSMYVCVGMPVPAFVAFYDFSTPAFPRFLLRSHFPCALSLSLSLSLSLAFSFTLGCEAFRSTFPLLFHCVNRKFYVN